jgi:hypothetical protein
LTKVLFDPRRDDAARPVVNNHLNSDAWLDQVLVGAEPLAREIFGRDGPTEVRRTRHWINRGYITVGKAGSMLISTRRKVREDLARLIPNGASK